MFHKEIGEIRRLNSLTLLLKNLIPQPHGLLSVPVQAVFHVNYLHDLFTLLVTYVRANKPVNIKK